ncbi:hypothetical protein [Methylobacterium sp. Leaf99]|uniref:hypothetical protein n=1 Tax=Methylobacterium sp. Leaf99 TaxID=1736251 RepID=UPI000AFCB94E|nr:hypothetical protein [Methylobacterium sp. Leaf99]
MASYAAVETALARLHDANPEVQRGAFRGRLKHLQRLGLPLGEKPGKGSRINYDAQQIWQLAVALELAEFGIDPTKIVLIIKHQWRESISIRIDEALEKFGERDETLELYVSFMSSAWTGREIQGGGMPASIYPNFVRPPTRTNRRSIIINLRSMVEELTQHFSDLGVDLSEE